MSEPSQGLESPAPVEAPPSPWREITRPFVDLARAPRALWGVNLAYTIEGLSYFGILTYLAMHFSDFIFRGVEHADVWSHDMVMVLTAGIALSMVVLGFVPDKWGVRPALILSFVLLLAGRVVMAAAPTLLAMKPDGLWSPLHLTTMAGIVLMLLGVGIYQPAAYAAVRQFTTPKTAAMAYAMLYALMNAGGSLAMLAFLLRDDKFLGLGIVGTFWIYTALTVVSLLATVILLSRRTVEKATADARAATAASGPEVNAAPVKAEVKAEAKSVTRTARVPVTAWVVLVAALAVTWFRLPAPWNLRASVLVAALPLAIAVLPRGARQAVLGWVANHPLADGKFFFFIFALIPVQTLFTYNWLVLPQYISRSYEGWVGEYFEIASNVNPILIFVLVPVITALTWRANVYRMMIAGTFVMGSSAFVLALGANWVTLVVYLLLMTVGEAMWSARFLQYATEIAPEGRAGQYQGVAQLPWFLTKFLVPLLYSGQVMERYCPATGPRDTQTMWLIFGFIAVSSSALLVAAKGWLGRDFHRSGAGSAG